MLVSSVFQPFDEVQTVVWDHNSAKESIAPGLYETLMKSLFKFLGPFQIATKEMETSKIPTIHMVCCTRISMIRCFQVSAQDKPDLDNLHRIEKIVEREVRDERVPCHGHVSGPTSDKKS